MSFDARPARPQRIAVIGGGISGLASAYLLGREHDVTLYESAPRLGGHARTIMAGREGNQPVDTGFIVFNYANYPGLTAMFRDLDVPVERSDMSFGASIGGGAVEYGLAGLPALLAQKRNIARPGFLRMLRDIHRFNETAEAVAVSDDITIGELTDLLHLGPWFRHYYLMPICGAIWSTPASEIGAFPARTLVSFFRNHALLSASGQHQWWTVSGGSISYVSRLERRLRDWGVSIETGATVRGITRSGIESTLHVAGREARSFDHVILACHSDQALALLDRPTAEERAALSAIRYQDNHAFLHRDPAQMPHRRAAWSAWNYRSDGTGDGARLGVTYWMNRLQNIDPSDPLFLTLNPSRPIDEAAIYDSHTFRHPVFDRAALRGQAALHGLQGRNNTWFAGAYTRHGFHEDGFASARRIARAMDTIFA